MKYFKECIKPALAKLYKNDIYLLEKGVHEQTISARIAKYIEDVIEDLTTDSEVRDKVIGSNVDCEFNKNMDKQKTLSGIRSVNIRPDIICHYRGNPDKNRFVVEIKKDDDICDECKIVKIVDELKYEEGYAIQEIKEDSFYVFFYNGDEVRCYFSVTKNDGEINIERKTNTAS